jgi:C4-dicarboxylate-specific signal transduction histidine kinase
MTFDSHSRGKPGLHWLALCVTLLVAVGAVDYATEVNVSILYLAPAFVAAWFFGSQPTVMVALFGAVTLAACLLIVFAGHTFAQGPMHMAWDGAIQLATCALFAYVIAKLKTALSHADERFATVLEGLDVAVYVAEADGGRLLYANAPFRRTFADGSAPPALPEGYRQGEVHEARSGRWFLVHVQPLRWLDGRMARLHIVTEVTEQRRNEELFLQQQEKLAMTARLIAVGEMATTLAHELNQPLAAIANYNSGCARRLRSGDWNAEELLEAMEKGAVQAERASSVILRLREFVARRQPKMEACDINEVVHGVRSTIEAEAAKRDVRLNLALSARIPYARADQTLMEQVILNLARNGIDAMESTPAAQRELRISSDGGTEGGMIEVKVADHGGGIAPELEANLFSPFFSTKPDGMGLGLHISRSIVEAHGGHLWVTRNGEQGTVFHFSLQSVYA